MIAGTGDLGTHVAPRPCPSCPYRRDVPAGIWHPDEYARLPAYDADTAYQPTGAFGCHRGDGRLCAGWLGHTDPHELLAVRLGIIHGELPPEIADYATDVPLFASGAQATAHGLSGVADPDARARAAAAKIVTLRRVR